MRTLSLLRHAKSDWSDPVARDFDRPLNGRGRRAAKRMGHYLAEQKLSFDQLIASPAVRVKETLAGVEAGYGTAFDPHYDPALYMAPPEALLELIQATADDIGHLLVAGHNPGLEELVLMLAGSGQRLRAEAEEKYPTAALATLRFTVDLWADVRRGGGEIIRFVRPRDLDPDLGPAG